MEKSIHVLDLCLNYTKIDKLNTLFIQEDIFIIKSSGWFDDFTNEEIQVFMYKKNLWVLPTLELIEWLKTYITNKTIEICSGLGFIGKELNIVTTDSYINELHKPNIKYPLYVEKLSAHQAILKYDPDTIIGGFVTEKSQIENACFSKFGVNEKDILKKGIKYIMIGNLDAHSSKTICNFKHQEIYLPGLITRYFDQNKNRVYLWNF